MSVLIDTYLDKYTEYLNLLNEPAARLISVLSKVNPRNVSEVARALGLSPSLTHYHLKRLINKRLLRISAKINYNKIGLRPAEVLFEVQLNRRKFIRDVIINHDFGYYLASCYGQLNGYYTRFVIPHGREIEFQLFLEELVRAGLINRYKLLWVDVFMYNSKWFNWFNFKTKKWIFRWDDWVNEICRSSYKNFNFKDYYDVLASPVKPDYVDIFILKELYKNACISFREIAEHMGLTAPAIRYHYYNHVVRFKFVSDYRPIVFPYPIAVSDMHIFRVNFDNEDSMNKFIASLDGKPFSLGTALIMGKKMISTTVYLPKTELSNFINALVELADVGIISDFSYVTLNLKDYNHETIPYQCFKDGEWIYNHEEYMALIAKVVKRAERVYNL